MKIISIFILISVAFNVHSEPTSTEIPNSIQKSQAPTQTETQIQTPNLNPQKPTYIGLLLPDTKTPRFLQYDKPLFEKKLKSLGNYEIIYFNADENALLQKRQADTLFDKGIEVLVLVAVDTTLAQRIVLEANKRDIPVIAYDRMIPKSKIAYFVSFDGVKVGELQGKALVDKLDADQAEGGLLVLNGPPTDTNALLYKDGASKFLNNRKYPVLATFIVPGWRKDRARNWVSEQIPKFSHDIVGVYAANDVLAGAVADAFKEAELPVPPVTGQDANLDAIQRIITGDQYMTVYKNFKLEAEKAAEAVVDLIIGNRAVGNTIVNNIPTTLIPVVAVTINNINSTVIKDGFHTVDQICRTAYVAACEKAGLMKAE